MTSTPLTTVTLTPLLSSSGDWLWLLGTLPVLALLVLWLAALVSILGSGFSLATKVLFVFGTLSFPLAGPLLWFLAVRRTDPTR